MIQINNWDRKLLIRYIERLLEGDTLAHFEIKKCWEILDRPND